MDQASWLNRRLRYLADIADLSDTRSTPSYLARIHRNHPPLHMFLRTALSARRQGHTGRLLMHQYQTDSTEKMTSIRQDQTEKLWATQPHSELVYRLSCKRLLRRKS